MKNTGLGVFKLPMPTVSHGSSRFAMSQYPSDNQRNSCYLTTALTLATSPAATTTSPTAGRRRALKDRHSPAPRRCPGSLHVASSSVAHVKQARDHRTAPHLLHLRDTAAPRASTAAWPCSFYGNTAPRQDARTGHDGCNIHGEAAAAAHTVQAVPEKTALRGKSPHGAGCRDPGAHAPPPHEG